MNKDKLDFNSVGESLPNEQTSAVNIRVRLWRVYQLLLEASQQSNRDEDKKANTSALNTNRELTKEHI
jgi:hypothetical protein